MGNKVCCSVVFLLLLIVLNPVRNECRESFMTICSNIKDVEKHPDKMNWRELMIGEENEENAVLSNFSFDDLSLYKMKKLNRLVINRRINNLNKIGGYCSYVGPLKFITLANNDFRTISSAQFLNIQLTRLSLVNNNIQEVVAGIFEHWSVGITDIDLSFNKIEVIEAQKRPHFDNKTNSISITHNKLVHIEPNAFPNSIKILNLDYNNLRYLINGVLEKLEQLKELSLSHNQFYNLPFINNLINLRHFDFSYNNLVEIDAQLFSQHTKLQLLDLSRNNIEQVDNFSDLFQDKMNKNLAVSLAFNQLGNLNLTDAKIREQEFVLFGNIWDCTAWETISLIVSNNQNRCDKNHFSSGKVPYCFQFKDAKYTSPIEIQEDRDRFVNSIHNNKHLVGCKLEGQNLDSKTTVVYCAA